MLRVTLRNVDVMRPDRTLSFLLQVDDKGQYHVHDCKPTVPNMDKMVGSHSRVQSSFFCLPKHCSLTLLAFLPSRSVRALRRLRSWRAPRTFPSSSSACVARSRPPSPTSSEVARGRRLAAAGWGRADFFFSCDADARSRCSSFVCLVCVSCSRASKCFLVCDPSVALGAISQLFQHLPLPAIHLSAAVLPIVGEPAGLNECSHMFHHFEAHHPQGFT
jgi:hypothetical protein